MKRKTVLILFFAAAAVICAVGGFLLIFTGKGYHSFFSWQNMNLDGNCMIYDVKNKVYLDDAEMHVHVFRRQKAGEDLTKGKFVIKGLLDLEKLNTEAGEDVFYTQMVNCYSLNGQPGLYYEITRYENMPAGSEQTQEITAFLPKAALSWQQEGKTAIVKLAYGEQYDEDVRYLVFYGFSDREAAKQYADSLN